jgi:hypothetical protein
MCHCYFAVYNGQKLAGENFGYFRYQQPNGDYVNYYFHEFSSKNSDTTESNLHLIVKEGEYSEATIKRIMTKGKKNIDNSDDLINKIRKFMLNNNLIELERRKSTLCKDARKPAGCTRINCLYNHDIESTLCPFEKQYGKCKRLECSFQHENENYQDLMSRTLCKFTYKGGCKNERCKFNHDMSQFYCPFQQEFGKCTRDNCQYSHEDSVDADESASDGGDIPEDYSVEDEDEVVASITVDDSVVESDAVYVDDNGVKTIVASHLKGVLGVKA